VGQIGGIFHINMNCSNFERSRAFYESVGFRMAIEFPEGRYPDVERGLGIGEHRVRGALFVIGETSNPTFLDLLEWDGPKDEARLRAEPTAIGSPRLALWTQALDAEVERLSGLGVCFSSEPVSVTGPTGQTGRFVCFPDPDGHIVELLEVPAR
jgi:catechol 2,3-dioxygenase-like lactoylglutathione lyase family enzyme